MAHSDDCTREGGILDPKGAACTTHHTPHTRSTGTVVLHRGSSKKEKKNMGQGCDGIAALAAAGDGASSP